MQIIDGPRKEKRLLDVKLDPAWVVDGVKWDSAVLVALTVDGKDYLLPRTEAVNLANALLRVAATVPPIS